MSSIVKDYFETNSEKISLLEDVCGCSLKPQYALQAIVCSGYANEFNQVSGNEIIDHNGLATVGDAILKALLSLELFDKKPSISKGELTDSKKS